MPSFNDSAAVDAELAADWAAIKEKYTVAEPAGAPETESAPVDTGAPASVEAVKTEPAKSDTDTVRDASGRFVKRDAVKADPAKASAAAVPEPVKAGGAPAAEPAKAAAAATPEPTTEGTQRDTSRPPSTWKPTARAEWAKLPPAVQAEIHRREADFMAGQSQLLPDAKFGASLRQVIEPYRALISSQGGTPEIAVSNLLRTAAVFAMGSPVQKQQAIASIAQEYGVDLRALVQPGAEGAPQPAPPPPGDPRVDQIYQYLTQQEQQRAQAEAREREMAVSNWANAKDAAGNPLRPYVDDVASEMSAYMPLIRQAKPGASHADILQEAYEQACWANPEVRQLLLREQQTAAEAKRLADSQQRVAEAKRAASVNVPRRASIPSTGKPGSLDETLRDTARQLGLISA